jgi:predicted MFS family arabinose efflux permease
LAIGQLGSAFAPNYLAVLVLRLLMLAVAAIYTPQAASTIAMIVTERERASAISFVFLGWSLSVAVALPVVTFLSAHFGWRATYGVLGATAAAAFALNLVGLPSGLRGAPLSLASWTAIARSRAIILLLTVTLCWTAAMFVIFPYLVPPVCAACRRRGWDRGRVLCALRRDGLPGQRSRDPGCRPVRGV